MFSEKLTMTISGSEILEETFKQKSTYYVFNVFFQQSTCIVFALNGNNKFVTKEK